jgi:hypothetical protein
MGVVIKPGQLSEVICAQHSHPGSAVTAKTQCWSGDHLNAETLWTALQGRDQRSSHLACTRTKRFALSNDLLKHSRLHWEESTATTLYFSFLYPASHGGEVIWDTRLSQASQLQLCCFAHSRSRVGRTPYCASRAEMSAS